MEENQNVIIKNSDNKDEPKKYTKYIIIAIIIIIGIIYFFMKNDCVSKVKYIPEAGSGDWKISSYYTIGGFDNFKTQDEAVSYCMSKKFKFN